MDSQIDIQQNTHMQELVCCVAPRWAWEMIYSPENTEADVWPCAILALQIASAKADPDPLTRADLFQLEEWADLQKDSSGNPCVWLNSYVNERGEHWTSEWSCQCDDNGYSPAAYSWIGPMDPAHKTLWEMLPEKE